MPSTTPTPFELDLFNFLNTLSQEGSKNYIYLDSVGIPTVGVGSALVVIGTNGTLSPVLNLDDIVNNFVTNVTSGAGSTVQKIALAGMIRAEINRIIDARNTGADEATVTASSTFAQSSTAPAGLGGTLTPQGVQDIFVLRYRDPLGDNGGEFGFEGVDGLIARAFDAHTHSHSNRIISFRDWDNLKVAHPARAVVIPPFIEGFKSRTVLSSHGHAHG